MEQKGLLITFMDNRSLKTEQLSKNILRKNTKPVYIVTNEKSRDYVLYTTTPRESEDSSAKRRHLTCRTCGGSIPHRKGQKLSKDCLIEESPDQISKAWSKKVVDWVEDYVQSSLREPGDVRPMDTRTTSRQLKSFCYGISTNLFSVESDCEVRLRLSQEEISRLSLNYNFIGFIVSYLASEEYIELLRSFLQEPEEEDVFQEICQPAGYFFCSSDRNKRNQHLEHLQRVLDNDIKAACQGLGESTGSLVCGALIALIAAELASLYGSAQDFNEEEEDVQPCPQQTEMNYEFENMVKEFDEKTELKVEVRCNKKIYSLYRNKSLNGWGPVGKKLLHSGRTFTFGLCIKNFSITQNKWQVQLLQNYEDTHNLASSFHFMAFAKHLMMIREWRMKLDILRQDVNKGEIIQDISELAAGFFCDRSGKRDAFRKHFQGEMKKKCRNIQNFPGETEGLYVMGVGLVVLGALSAVSISQQEEENEQESVDGVQEDVAPSSQERVDGVQEDVASRAQERVDGGAKEDVAPSAQEHVDGGAQEEVAPSAQERVDGGAQEDVAPSAQERVDGGAQEDVAPSAQERVDGGAQEDVAPSAQESVDGGAKEDVAPSAQESVDGGAKKDVAPRAQESVDGGAKKDVAPRAQEIVDGGAKKDEAPRAQESVDGGAQEDVAPSAQERVDGGAQEDVAPSAQESVDGGAKEDVAPSAQESVDRGAKKDVAPRAQESVDGGAKKDVAPRAQEIVDGGAKKDEAPRAQESVDGGAQEDVAPRAQESVDGGGKEDVTPSALESVDGGAQEDVAPRAQESVDGGGKEDVALSAQEHVDGGAQEDVAPSAQESVDGGAQKHLTYEKSVGTSTQGTEWATGRELNTTLQNSMNMELQETVSIDTPQRRRAHTGKRLFNSVSRGKRKPRLEGIGKKGSNSVNDRRLKESVEQGIQHRTTNADNRELEDDADGAEIKILEGEQRSLQNEQESVDSSDQEDKALSQRERVAGGAQQAVAPSAQESVDGGAQEDVAPSAQDITELAAKFFYDRSGRRDVFRKHFQEEMKKKCGNIQNFPGETEELYVMGVGLVVLGALSALSISQQEEENEQESVDGGAKKDVAPRAQEIVDGGAKKDEAPRAQEIVDGGAKKDVAPRAQESVDGGAKKDVAPRAQESVDGGAKKDEAPRAQESVDGGAKKDEAPRAQEIVDGGAKKDEAPRAQESVDGGGGKEDVAPRAQESVDGGAKKDEAPRAQESVDGGGGKEDVAPRAQESVDGGAQEDVGSSDDEGVESSTDEQNGEAGVHPQTPRGANINGEYNPDVNKPSHIFLILKRLNLIPYSLLAFLLLIILLLIIFYVCDISGFDMGVRFRVLTKKPWGNLPPF